MYLFIYLFIPYANNQGSSEVQEALTATRSLPHTPGYLQVFVRVTAQHINRHHGRLQHTREKHQAKHYALGQHIFPNFFASVLDFQSVDDVWLVCLAETTRQWLVG